MYIIYMLKYFDTEGKYSFTRPFYAKKVTKVISELSGIDRDSSILDGTCGLSGDTIHFSKFFNTVFSLEKNPERSLLALKNLEYNNITNVHLATGDILSLPDTLHFDVIYIDPPWGGPNYKKKKSVSLEMSGLPMNAVVQNVSKHCKYLVMKLPKNAENLDKSGFLYKKYKFIKFDILVLTKINIFQ